MNRNAAGPCPAGFRQFLNQVEVPFDCAALRSGQALPSPPEKPFQVRKQVRRGPQDDKYFLGGWGEMRG